MRKELKIDPEFASISSKVTEYDFKKLEELILSYGEICSPIITWNETIVDGHYRYKIAQMHPELQYRTCEHQFNNRYKAIEWILKKQLIIRDLDENQIRDIVFQLAEIKKKIFEADMKQLKDFTKIMEGK